tara:strand:+ start:652 stop:1527 length:876 start_codon:yes stop_codon:yes gene_type:complete
MNIEIIKQEIYSAKSRLEEEAKKIQQELKESLPSSAFDVEERKNKPQRDEIESIVKKKMETEDPKFETQIRIWVCQDYKWKEKNKYTAFYNATINSSEKRINSFIKKGEQAFGVEFSQYATRIWDKFDIIISLQDTLETVRKQRKSKSELKNLTFDELYNSEAHKAHHPVFQGEIWKVADEYRQAYVDEFVSQAKWEYLTDSHKCKSDWGEKQIKEATSQANFQVLAYVDKLQNKINKEVVSAEIEGSLWRHSTLRVVCADGEEQVWVTKHIINYSCYGLQFPQWPTRRID